MTTKEQKRNWYLKNAKIYTKKCDNCGVKFQTRSEIRKKYCSEACRKKAYAKTEKGITAKKVHSTVRRDRIKKLNKLSIKIVRKVYHNNIKKYGKLTCVYCDIECCDSWHLEHLTPISRGGTNDYDNLAISCPRCNLEKGVKTVDEYIKYKKAKT
jgi:5-methylcytosine-specific restriction endonuclease McrA